MRIASVEYYEAQAAQATEDASGVPSHSAGRDAVSYYTDNGATETAGEWWLRRSDASQFSFPTPSPFRSLQNGAAMDWRALRDLSQGRDPQTKDPLVKQSANGKRSAGFDIQIAAPKSVSLLAAFGDDAQREAVFAAHDRAFRKALDHVFDTGLIDCRQGKGGKDRGAPAEAGAAIFRHFTSRAKDPQLHSHGLLINCAVREDCTVGSIDNSTIMQYRGAVAALYRTELASELRRTLGVEGVRAGRNFEVAGIPEAVRDRFSKRRQQIEKIAEAMGFDVSKDREAAKNISLNSRAEKDKETPLWELEETWVRELLAEGWTPGALFSSTEAEAQRVKMEREGEGEEGRQERLLMLSKKAIADLTATEATFTEPVLLRHVLEALQCDAQNADEALAVVESLKARGLVIRLGEAEGHAVYSTRELVETEKAMLTAAHEMRDRREYVAADVLDRVLASRETMAAEQKAAVRHALNRDGVSIVEGSAGAGKSFAMSAVAEVARDCGAEVWTIAPAWKAVDVIRSDTDTAEEMARAVSGFVQRVAKGDIVLKPQSVVIVDEAGMIGTSDMAALVQLASQADVKLVCAGDTKQLQPVVAGAPMAALSRFLGSSRMNEIRRQKGRSDAEGAWMRAASQDFATGDPIRAFEAYDRAGNVRLCDDRDATIEAVAQAYIRARIMPPFLHGDGENRERTRAVLTAWNTDVRALNEVIRAKLRERNLLGGDETTVQAIPRGGSKPVDLALTKGDEIIFGESVEIGSTTIRNADLARIERIEATDGQNNPLLTIRLHKQRGAPPIQARLSELVGYREDGQAHAPRIQHSYAMTVHAAQGVTVDECFVADMRGMGRESAYVAMTRHRERVEFFADASRVRDALEARGSGATVRVGTAGTALPEDGDRREGITDADVKKALFNESTRSDRKANAADFVADIGDWLGVAPPTVTPAKIEEKRPEARPAPPLKEFPQPNKESSTPTPLETRSEAAEELRKRMESRAAASVKYPPPSIVESRRITEQELNQFVKTNLIDFARDFLGAKIIETWNGGKSAKVLIDKDKISMSDKGDKWVWSQAGGGAGGVIWGLVSHVQGIATGPAMHFLRDALKTWTPTPRPAPAMERAAAGTPLALSEMRQRWAKMRDAVSLWLLSRALQAETIRAVRSDVRAESDHVLAGNRYGAAFAHRNGDGELVGYARRGDKFRGMSAGGTNSLFVSGDKATPREILVTESAIDTLSKWQMDGRPSGVLLVATDGNPSALALETVTSLARRHPEAVWRIGTDNDAKGQSYGRQIALAAREGAPGCKIENIQPPKSFKDWNDVLRNRTVEDALREKAEAEAKASAEADRKAAEEAMRQEEARKNQPQVLRR